MNTSFPHWRNAALAAVAMTATISLVACSPTTDDSSPGVPGVTADTVKIGTHTALTGPAAPGYTAISSAAKAFFTYVNDKGGVHGRTIDYIIKDDAYNPAKTQSVVRELIQDDQVFAIFNGHGTSTHASVIEYINDNKVPDLFVASGSTLLNQPDKYPYTFLLIASYVAEGAALAQYALDESPGARICVLGQDDDLGDSITEGVKLALGEDGIALREQYSTSNPDLTAQVGAMQAAGCEVNILGSLTPYTALALGSAARIGWEPEWFVTSAGNDYTTLLELLGPDAGLADGLVGVNYLPAAAGESEWITLFRSINDDYNGGATFDGNVVFGMSAAYLFVEALTAAGESPTRESIVEAIEAGRLKGNGIAPLSYATDNHGSYLTLGINVVADGVQDFIGTAYTTTGDTITQTTIEPVEFVPGGIP
ncbi:MAG: ABC transporter substrate-binding protein [Leucobacter sp.]|nr:ABC transporter substrate-binding protein [Leucobacter sp.]